METGAISFPFEAAFSMFVANIENLPHSRHDLRLLSTKAVKLRRSPEAWK
jgi:hypothetical protein